MFTTLIRWLFNFSVIVSSSGLYRPGYFDINNVIKSYARFEDLFSNQIGRPTVLEEIGNLLTRVRKSLETIYAETVMEPVS